MFMSQEQLRDLSGAHKRYRVINWLQDNGYKFQIGADGWPRVLVEVVNQRLGLKQTPIPKKAEPDFSWMN